MGLLLGSIYQRFSRMGEFVFFGIVFLLVSVFVLLGSYWHWWEAISGWLVQQTAAALGLWLLPVMAIFVLASYALLRQATVCRASKSSSMMEILVNAATPFQLLADKIVGIGAACLTQMSGMVAVGIVGLLHACIATAC